MTGIIDNEGKTIAEKAVGEKTTAIIKTTVKAANVANGILDLKKLKNDPTKTVNKKKVEIVGATAGIVSDAATTADNVSKIKKEKE